MRADLHVHSSASDGTDPPAEVMRRAALAGLDVVALTGHDTVPGHGEAPAAAGRTSPGRWRTAAPSPPPARRSPVTGSPTAAAPTSAGTRSTRSAPSAWSGRRAA